MNIANLRPFIVTSSQKNDLIDDNFEALFTDFGIAKFNIDNNTHVLTEVKGTQGNILHYNNKNYKTLNNLRVHMISHYNDMLDHPYTSNNFITSLLFSFLHLRSIIFK